MPTTQIRANDLPLPAVEVGQLVTIGHATHAATLREVTVGGTVLFQGRAALYSECWKCSGRGFIASYAGIYGGVCFACNGLGARPFAATVEAAQRKVRSEQAADLRAAAKAEAARPAREAAAAAAALQAIEDAHEAALREEERQAAHRALVASKRFAGEVGTKVTVTGTVIRNTSIESNFGYRKSFSRLVIVEGTGADEGITIKTFGTSEWHYAVEAGEQVTITATVKDHAHYGGIPQTVVIRPKNRSNA